MNTSRVAFLLVSIFLGSSCFSFRQDYTPSVIDSSDAKSVIEQVFMEQPQKLRPEYVSIEEKFIGISDGLSSSSRSSGVAVRLDNGVVVGGGAGRGTSKALNSRIYYSSIGEARLYKKGRWYIVCIRDTEGDIMQRVWTKNRDKAERLIDSILSLSASGSG